MDDDQFIEHRYFPEFRDGMEEPVRPPWYEHSIEQDGRFSFEYVIDLKKISEGRIRPTYDGSPALTQLFPKALRDVPEARGERREGPAPVEFSGEFDIPREEVDRIGEWLNEEGFFEYDERYRVVDPDTENAFLTGEDPADRDAENPPPQEREFLAVNYDGESTGLGWSKWAHHQRSRESMLDPTFRLPSYQTGEWVFMKTVSTLYHMVKENGVLEDAESGVDLRPFL